MNSIFIGMLASMGFTVVLLGLAYWLTGGTQGVHALIPTDPGEPPKLPTKKQILARLGLVFILKIWVLGAAGMLGSWLPDAVFQGGGFVASFLLFGRAIGDLKYRGITKRVKGTPFALADRKLYTPLALVLALLSFLTSIRF